MQTAHKPIDTPYEITRSDMLALQIDDKKEDIKKSFKDYKTVGQLLGSELLPKRIGELLPKHFTKEKMLRIIIGSVQKNPKLQRCTPESFLSAVMDASQMGLEIGGPLGHGALTPFFNSKTSVMGCKYLIQYKGYIELAHRTGKMGSIHADVVFKDDLFNFQYGNKAFLIHKPNFTAQPNDPHFLMAYAYCNLLKSGRYGFQFEVLSKQEIDRIKDKVTNNFIWDESYHEMAKKTALRRLFKKIPLSPEIRDFVDTQESDFFSEQEESKPQLILTQSPLEEKI